MWNSCSISETGSLNSCHQKFVCFTRSGIQSSFISQAHIWGWYCEPFIFYYGIWLFRFFLISTPDSNWGLHIFFQMLNCCVTMKSYNKNILDKTSNFFSILSFQAPTDVCACFSRCWIVVVLIWNLTSNTFYKTSSFISMLCFHESTLIVCIHRRTSRFNFAKPLGCVVLQLNLDAKLATAICSCLKTSLAICITHYCIFTCCLD